MEVAKLDEVGDRITHNSRAWTHSTFKLNKIREHSRSTQLNKRSSEYIRFFSFPKVKVKDFKKKKRENIHSIQT
jgi:hypothetical protein